MKFCIITHVDHFKFQDNYYAYAPYVREMNIWLKYVDSVLIVAPIEKNETTTIDLSYECAKIEFMPVKSFNLTGFKEFFKASYLLPVLFFKVFKAMFSADHIHLRCPGNMGLIGCVVQVFFPKKKKTVKYAGNWDLNAAQPWSYRFQKWILNNTFLTKNMQVLVYGAWERSSANIKPFFTATYSESEKEEVVVRNLDDTIQFLFVGTLSEGKRPLYAIQLVEQLIQSGRNVSLAFYGEGIQRNLLENYIQNHNLGAFIKLKGNQTKEVLLEAYKKAHFLILASKSEGWPKAVAEAMFWGCIPLATRISCVPDMLNDGKRGLLLNLDLAEDVEQIETLLSHPALFEHMGKEAEAWSRLYTTEKFEEEIKNLL